MFFAMAITTGTFRARSHCIKIVRFCIERFRLIVCITVTLCCFGSALWCFCIRHGRERNHVNWFISRTLALMFAFLGFSCCLPVCFLNSRRSSLLKHSGRKTVLLPSMLKLSLSRMEPRAGPGCLSENNFPTLFLEFFFIFFGKPKFLKKNQP